MVTIVTYLIDDFEDRSTTPRALHGVDHLRNSALDVFFRSEWSGEVALALRGKLPSQVCRILADIHREADSLQKVFGWEVRADFDFFLELPSERNGDLELVGGCEIGQRQLSSKDDSNSDDVRPGGAGRAAAMAACPWRGATTCGASLW